MPKRRGRPPHGPTHRYTIRVPIPLWMEAAQIAHKQNRPLVDLINEALTNYVTHQRTQP